MSFGVSGQDLLNWRNQAMQNAVAHQINPKEVDWLLQDVARLDSLTLRLENFASRSNIELTLPLSQLTQLWQRRCYERVPVQYLVGCTPWRDLVLKVTPDVLIPRPETEYIIDIVLEAVKDHPELARGNWVDLGTGSGAIAIALAKVFPRGTIHAVDSSPQALQVAQENASNLGFEKNIKFHLGSWWQPLESVKGKISGMVSNPPYIPTEMLAGLQPEVIRHEPSQALDGGEDGLEAIRYLVKTAPSYLCAGGVWLIEMMAGQGNAVKALLEQQGRYTNISILFDFAGIDRFVLAYIQK